MSVNCFKHFSSKPQTATINSSMPFDINIYNLNQRARNIPCVCDFCNSTFEKSRHSIGIQINRNQTLTFCNSSCCNLYRTKERHNLVCLTCEKPISKRDVDMRKSKNHFCSRSCSAKHTNANRLPTSEETKIKISNSLKSRKRDKIYSKSYKCVVCNSDFTVTTHNKRKTCDNPECRRVLFQQGGKNSAAVTRNRSKDEIELFNLCSEHFTKVESNKVILDGWDADIVINDNILVLWNGPWHYMDIKMKGVSLKKIQNRDHIKIDLFLDHGYHVLIYEDRYFTPTKAFDDLKYHVMDTGAGFEPLMRV